MTTKEYVQAFGKMRLNPDMGPEVERLLLSVPDSDTFLRIRRMYFNTYHSPFLPSFLKNQSPEIHRRILSAFKKASGNYE